MKHNIRVLMLQHDYIKSKHSIVNSMIQTPNPGTCSYETSYNT